VRVVANKYPIASPSSSGIDGVHEVGIDAREHDRDLASLDVGHIATMLAVYRDRVRALEALPSIRSVLLFRNRGRRAGSSQPHPHTQIVGTGWVPAEVALRWEIAERHFHEQGTSVHAASIERELADGVRMIAADEHALSFCPYAPSRAFEVRIAPRAPRGGFASATEQELRSTAAHLKNAALRLEERHGIVDMNLVLRQPPASAPAPAAAWHFDLLPRTGGDAGFELSSGEMIVVVGPEEAARSLR
jgi:UDPglucose--hexose-1-phosphate uridylyltransferase